MEIQFVTRPLIEVQLSFEDDSNDETTDELASWLEDHATFNHKESDEFILWIPPSGAAQDKYIEGEYGNAVPEIIAQILKEGIKLQQGKADQGYILIVFV